MNAIAWLAIATKRLLMSLGLVKRKPYTCRICGYVVPLVGRREWQADVAYLHWETKHWEAPDA